MSDVVGVLALQGAYEKHVEMLSGLGVESRLVRFARELDDCCALIIPGGESTTMSLLIQKFNLYDILREFAEKKPVMGVCAGAILMAETVDDSRVIPLKIMPITALRNNYGRQVSSFSANLNLKCDDEDSAYAAHFIRAPGLASNNDIVEELASYNNEPVMMRMGLHMALSFHPELTNDDRVHVCWLSGFHPSFQ
ncbi:MAG: pyridoxal 5'-phosphate synthase glutaminase subunit PdxT [Gammaproteobacteria bacterium]|nr:pyridoxal 5'-phosphate synthase glutaminase subunit PdxT [Gammaproteobacteria bacterium]